MKGSKKLETTDFKRLRLVSIRNYLIMGKYKNAENVLKGFKAIQNIFGYFGNELYLLSVSLSTQSG